MGLGSSVDLSSKFDVAPDMCGVLAMGKVNSVTGVRVKQGFNMYNPL